MSIRQTDRLNILLILLSLGVAFSFPFELFLFSYAVLGPLHYLTEIDWLDKRNFFTRHREWVWVFVATAAIISIPSIFKIPIIKPLLEFYPIHEFVVISRRLFDNGLLMLLIFAATLGFIDDKRMIPLCLLGCMLVGTLILKFLPNSVLLVSILLPTIIHVYFFTLLFMVYGFRRSRSPEGLLAILMLCSCPFIIFGTDWPSFGRQQSGLALDIFTETGFKRLNMLISSMFADVREFDARNPIVQKTQVMIAFSYTYHYLNWFSKTTSIGWQRNMSKNRLIAMMGISIGFTTMFWYNYHIGLGALFFLSTLHVLLEFPLNIRSVSGIFTGR